MKTSDVCPYHFCYLIIVVIVVIITIIAHIHLHLHHHHPHCSLFTQCAADAERQQIRAFQTLSTHFEGFSSLGANAAFSKFWKINFASIFLDIEHIF